MLPLEGVTRVVRLHLPSFPYSDATGYAAGENVQLSVYLLFWPNSTFRRIRKYSEDTQFWSIFGLTEFRFDRNL